MENDLKLPKKPDEKDFEGIKLTGHAVRIRPYKMIIMSKEKYEKLISSEPVEQPEQSPDSP
jgi:hypothetical protein